LGYRISKKEKMLLSLLMLIVIIYLYLSFFLFPETEKIKQIKKSLNTHNNVSVKNKALNKYKIQDEKKLLPLEENIDEIANNIKIYADNSGIELEKISFGECGILNNSLYVIKFIPIYISFTGKNKNKIAYLNMIENDKRMCEISDINIDYADDINSKASANIKYYFLASSSDIKK
jgi:hypothetical protein